MECLENHSLDCVFLWDGPALASIWELSPLDAASTYPLARLRTLARALCLGGLAVRLYYLIEHGDGMWDRVRIPLLLTLSLSLPHTLFCAQSSRTPTSSRCSLPSS